MPRIAASIWIAALFGSGSAFAIQPTPVRPVVDESTFENGLARVRLQQDLCYAWDTPQVSRVGNEVAITQAVARRDTCLVAGPGVRAFLDVELGRLEAGAYRLRYTPTGSNDFADYAFDFDVNAMGTGPATRMIRFEPANPTALESVTAVIDLNVCDAVAGFRMGNRALEIVATHVDGWCDYDIPRDVAIGSFPPGEYLVRVVRPEGAVLSEKSLVVGPGRGNPPNFAYARDLSGVWANPDEEPGTAIVFFNSADRLPDGTQRNGLTGIWYRYDANGQPVWYLLELNADAVFWSTYTGNVRRYTATNPGEFAFTQTIAGTSIGTVTIDEEPMSGLPRLRGTVDGRAVDVSLRPFRWTRNAWGQGNPIGATR